MSSKPHERDEQSDAPDDAEVNDVEDDFDGAETVILSGDDDDDDDEALDVSMEVNVEKLMAEMDKTKADDVARKKEIRRRLEEIQESRSLEDTYSFDLYGED